MIPTLKPYFEKAGWFEGRQHLIPSIKEDHPVQPIIAEFGGLQIMDDEDDYAIEFVHFGETDDIDKLPSKLANYLDIILKKLADTDNRHAELYIDEKGRFFGNSIMHDCLWYYGDGFWNTADSIIQRKRTPAIILPSQKSISYYGDELTRHSKGIMTIEMLKAM